MKIKTDENYTIYQSPVVKNDLDPVWQPFDLLVSECKGLNHKLIFEVWDHDKGTDDFIGTCSISLRHLMYWEKNPKWRLRNPKGTRANYGYLQVISLTPAISGPSMAATKDYHSAMPPQGMQQGGMPYQSGYPQQGGMPYQSGYPPQVPYGMPQQGGMPYQSGMPQQKALYPTNAPQPGGMPYQSGMHQQGALYPSNTPHQTGMPQQGALYPSNAPHQGGMPYQSGVPNQYSPQPQRDMQPNIGNVNLNKTPTPSSNPGLNLNKPKQDNLPAYMKGL